MPLRSANKTASKKPSPSVRKQPALAPAPDPSPVEAEASPAAAGGAGKEETPAADANAVAAPKPAPEEGKGAIVEVKPEADEEERVSEEEEEEKIVGDPALVKETGNEGAVADGKSVGASRREGEFKREAVSIEEENVEALSEKNHDSTPVEIEEDEGQNQMIVEKGKDASKETLEDVSEATIGDEDIHDLGDGDTSQSDDDADSEENEDVQSLHLNAPMSEMKKQKQVEIFIGGLDKGAVDEDLVNVFGVFGEIHMVRIVRNPSTQKSKGYAFVRYASPEHAKKALSELKDGIEIRGKRVGISATQDNDTLYLGNICKTWTKEKVIETLKGYGIEEIEHIRMPDDPKSDGKNKGYAFLEFSSHSDAMTAFQRLRKPDAVFGRDRSAKVAIAQSPMHPCNEIMLQVKTVYLENIPNSWNELQIKELCQQYGELQKVQLFRKSKTKRKDFAFVEFSSRESAIACIEGINNAQIGEGDIKIDANLARPVKKAWLSKRGARGGFKISSGGEAAEDVKKPAKKKKGKLKELSKKEKSRLKPHKVEQHKKFKFQGKGAKQNNIAQPVKLRKDSFAASVKSQKGKRSAAGRMDADFNTRPSKKARHYKNFGHTHGTHANVLNDQRAMYSGNPSISYVTQPTIYTSRYPPTATAYHAYPYSGASSPAARPSYLEPHAGYLSYGKQNQNPYGYEQRRFGGYDSQMMISSGYSGASAAQTSYPARSDYAGHKARVSYPSRVYAGANTRAPYTEGSTHAPATAGNTHASYTAGSTPAPYTGGSAYAPHGGYY